MRPRGGPATAGTGRASIGTGPATTGTDRASIGTGPRGPAGRAVRATIAVGVAGALLGAGCGDQRVTGGGPSDPTAPRGGAAASSGANGNSSAGSSATPAIDAGPPPVSLDAAPRLDLIAQQRRWHRSAARGGLLISFAGDGATDGLAKYSLAYRSPWGDVVTRDGRRGRVLAASKATLTLPWIDAPAAAAPPSLHLRVAGAAKGQRLTVKLNGKAAAAVAVPAEWSELDVALPAGALQAGENVVELGFAKAKAIVHSIELTEAPGDATATAAVANPAVAASAAASDWPDAAPATADAAGLRGHRRLSMWLEIPPAAYLVGGVRTTAAGGRARVTMTAASGATAVLLDETYAAATGEAPYQLSLAAFADQVVRLDLEVLDAADPSTVTWLAPQLALVAAPAPRPIAAAKHLILLVVDTLRSDRLQLYGDTRVITPRLTAETEARGAVFLRNQAVAPSSPPSHASIHTGLIPRLHGIAGDHGEVAGGAPILSAILADAGFYTAYVGNNDFAMGNFREVGQWDEQHTPILQGKGGDCSAIVDEALEIASAQDERGKRFFLSLLPLEPHVPYSFHAGITEAYHDGPWSAPLGKSVSSAHLGRISSGSLKMTDALWAQLRGLYDGEVTYFDACLGRLFDGLRDNGQLDETAIIITSDHGEGLGERGRSTGHAYSLHSELTSVPLIVLPSGAMSAPTAAARVETPTSNLDILPTALDLVDVAVPTGGDRLAPQGTSLLPLAARGAPWLPRVIPSEYGRSYALRARDWKYLVGYDGKDAVYDTVADRDEASDVSDRQPLVTRYLRDAAGIYLAYRSRGLVVE